MYEYLISNFAANAGKKAGEFYTPHEVAILMSEIVAEHHKDKRQIEIYDPTSGSGSLLITIGKFCWRHISDKNRVKYYAQELKENTYNLTRMNLVMRGIQPSNINTRCADSLERIGLYIEQVVRLDSLFMLMLLSAIHLILNSGIQKIVRMMHVLKIMVLRQSLKQLCISPS